MIGGQLDHIGQGAAGGFKDTDQVLQGQSRLLFIRRHLSELNRLVSAGWLETEQDAVRLARRAELWVDVAAFQRLAAICRAHGHPVDAVCVQCIEPLTAAVELYRGDFLADFTLPDAPVPHGWRDALGGYFGRDVGGTSLARHNRYGADPRL